MSRNAKPCGKKRRRIAPSITRRTGADERQRSAISMTTIELPTCEVKLGQMWRTLSLSRRINGVAMALKRCAACHGRVRI